MSFYVESLNPDYLQLNRQRRLLILKSKKIFLPHLLSFCCSTRIHPKKREKKVKLNFSSVNGKQNRKSCGNEKKFRLSKVDRHLRCSGVPVSKPKTFETKKDGFVLFQPTLRSQMLGHEPASAFNRKLSNFWREKKKHKLAFNVSPSASNESGPIRLFWGG